MKNDISEKYRKQYEEFIKLNSLMDKLQFWERKLPLNFVSYNELETSQHELYNDLKDFSFSIAEEDRTKYANWLLANYHELSQSPDKFSNLLVYEFMISTIDKKLDEAENKSQCINNELWNIKESFQHVAHKQSGIFSRVGSGISIINTKYKADFSSFEAYKEFKIKPDYEKVYPMQSNILKAANGFTLARYWEYLENLNESLKTQPKKNDATLDQKLLILHYLGALDKIRKPDHATKAAIFLEKLIGNDYETIRQRMSYINDLFTPAQGKKKKLKQDLEEVQSLFKVLGIQIAVKNIQADLRKLV